MTTTEADGAYAFDELLWGTYAVRELLPPDCGEDEASFAGSILDDLFGDAGLLPEMPGAYYDFGGLAPLFWGETFIGDDREGVFPPGSADDLWFAVSQGETDVPNAAFFADLLEGTCQIASAGLPAGTDHPGPLGGAILVDMMGTELPADTPGLEYDFAADPVPANRPVDPPSDSTPGPNLPEPAEVMAEEGTCRLGGRVFAGLNGNLPGENAEGIAGISVTLTGVTAGGRPLSRTATTDDDGAYTFDALPAGLYSVARPTPQGFLDGGYLLGTVNGSTAGAIAADGFTRIALPEGGAALDYGFAAVRPACLGGVVWAADREFEDEPGTFSVAGKAGVTVELTGTDDHDRAIHRTTTSDAEGRYHFEGLYPGEYGVRVATPRGFRAVEARPGSKGGTGQAKRQIDAIRLNAGDDGSGYEFFYEGTGRVSGRVTCRPEPVRRTVGMAGVTLVLTGTGRDGRAVGRTAKTDAKGKYLFHALPPGTYRVEVKADPGRGPWTKSPAQVNGRPAGVPADDAVAVGGIALGADGRATDLDFTASGGAG